MRLWGDSEDGSSISPESPIAVCRHPAKSTQHTGWSVNDPSTARANATSSSSTRNIALTRAHLSTARESARGTSEDQNGQAVPGTPRRSATVRMRELRDCPDEQAEFGVDLISRDVGNRVPVQQCSKRAARRQQDDRHENRQAHRTGCVLQALSGNSTLTLLILTLYKCYKEHRILLNWQWVLLHFIVVRW
jgi:hypothetical protein